MLFSNTVPFPAVCVCVCVCVCARARAGEEGGRLGLKSIFVLVCSVAQLCPTLCYPMNCSPPGSSVHGLLQARILEWVAISSFRESSPPSDQTSISCMGRQVFYHWTTREANQRVSVHPNSYFVLRTLTLGLSEGVWSMGCLNITSFPHHVLKRLRHPATWCTFRAHPDQGW